MEGRVSVLRGGELWGSQRRQLRASRPSTTDRRRLTMAVQADTPLLERVHVRRARRHIVPVHLDVPPAVVVAHDHDDGARGRRGGGGQGHQAGRRERCGGAHLLVLKMMLKIEDLTLMTPDTRHPDNPDTQVGCVVLRP